MDINHLDRTITNTISIKTKKRNRTALKQEEQERVDDFYTFCKDSGKLQIITQLLKTQTPIGAMALKYNQFRNLTKNT